MYRSFFLAAVAAPTAAETWATEHVLAYSLQLQ